MTVFHCDLDNTLIYSHKREIGTEKVLVERYEGREVSYMTPESYINLKKVVDILTFVPTTTRSLSQYERIDLGISVPKYALVANGGMLLVDGEIDEDWYQESLSLIQASRKGLESAEKLMLEDENIDFPVKYVENLFLFTKSQEPELTAKNLEKALEKDYGNSLEVHTNGLKVYVLPKSMTKGRGVERFKERFQSKLVLSAGDSMFDCSMLEVADKSFAPSSLEKQEPEGGNWFICPENQLFSNRLLEEILKNSDEY